MRTSLGNRYRSDWYFGKYFHTPDRETPEGLEDANAHFAKAIEFRLHPPKGKTTLIIPCDANGIFGKPRAVTEEPAVAEGPAVEEEPKVSEKVLVACDRPDDNVRDFCKKFCELYLKRDGVRSKLGSVSHAAFPRETDYRAVIWVWGDDEEDAPFDVINDFYGQVSGKPVHIFTRATIDACKGKDFDSRFVLSRMEMVHEGALEEEGGEF